MKGLTGTHVGRVKASDCAARCPLSRDSGVTLANHRVLFFGVPMLAVVSTDWSAELNTLENSQPYPFRDWPATHFEVGPSGVYTIWNSDDFLYVGMAWRHRDDTTPRVTGVYGRLSSHASGRRSGDQFAVYVCDRFVVPRLSRDQMDALARGERLLDSLTRKFIHEHLTYRVVVAADGPSARALEVTIRRDGLPTAGRPLINP